MANNEKAVLRTILYADIFDYPLTADEIWQFLIADKSISGKSLQQILQNSQLPLVKVNRFFCLKGREEIVMKRLEREKESKKKLAIAKHAVKLLCYIPTIRLIGISGGLAMQNVDRDDDIDLFIITQQHTLWITRLLVVFLLRLLGLSRRRAVLPTANTICTNFFLDETELAFLNTDHDIYTAHEIIQMKPLVDRENTYERFIFANSWVKELLPNSFHQKPGIKNKEFRKNNNNFIFLLESFAKELQLWYMRNHKTTEITTSTKAAFHPFDHRKYVVDVFSKSLKIYGM